MKKVIDIHHVKFHYTEQSEIFTNLSFNLRTGKIHGILAKKGEGKTTLLKLISGLLFPLKGNVKILDFEAKKRKPAMLQKIFFLSEDLLESRLSTESFEKAYAPFYPDFSPSEFYQYLNNLLVDSKFDDFRKITLSQKKKFCIAFGLATKAQVILLDEPMMYLDKPSKMALGKLLTEVCNKNTCIVLATSDVAELDEILDNFIILHNHQVVLNESRQNLALKFSFESSSEIKDKTDCLYSEKHENGYRSICMNHSGEPGVVQTEPLFNAFTSGHIGILNDKKHQKSKKHE